MGKRDNIQNLLRKWPSGTVMLAKHLKDLGISTQLQSHYHKAGWLRRVGRGAYARGDDQDNFLGAIYALQSQLGLKVHIAGRSALSLHGIEHFVSMERAVIQVGGKPKTRLPAWFEDYWREKYSFFCSSQFSSSLGLVSYEEGDFSVLISNPERAFLEEFSRVNSSESFEHAAETFDLYSRWDLRLLRKLLMDSDSMRANRLFAFLSESHPSKSVQEFDFQDIPVGSSVIQYVKRGKFVSKHQIMVPEKFAASEGSPF